MPAQPDVDDNVSPTDFGYFRQHGNSNFLIIKLLAFCVYVVCFIVYLGLFFNNMHHIKNRGRSLTFAATYHDMVCDLCMLAFF